MSTRDKAALHEQMLLQFEVESFLYREAALLDERRFDEWLELLADDMHYWMPIRRTTNTKDIEQEFTQPGDMAFFDDDKDMLTLRIRRLSVGRAWAEDPPSRTRHFVTNVRVLEEQDGEVLVSSNLLLYRTRLNSEEDSWYGRREDRLRRHGESFLLSSRHIFLDQTVILSQNLSSLF